MSTSSQPSPPHLAAPVSDATKETPIVAESTDESIGTALKTGRSLFLLQLLSRLLTFALNQSLLRLSTPEVLGTASIQFDLISATILFLSREGIRNALLRRDPSGNAESKSRDASSSANKRLACVPLYLGLVVAGVTTTIYLKSSSQGTTTQTDFHLSLALYVIAALVELSIEPFYVRCLTTAPSQVGVRVQAEGGMAITKAVVTFALLYAYPSRALLGFGIGQLCGNTALALRYLYQYGLDGYLWVKTPTGPKTFQADVTRLAVANTRQSFIKHLLTEADRIAVGRISPLVDQGGYAIAMNYGSLIARIVFQPIEETLLIHFSANPTAPSNPPLLTMIVHLSAHLLLLLPAYLPPLLPPILSILLPRRYLITSAPYTLQTYLCFYIPLLSLNGILEAYHGATATPKQMSKQARWMIASSVVFVGGLYALKGRLTNETALISASCMGMTVRILYAFLYAEKKTGMGVRTLAPKSAVTIVVVISAAVLRRIYRTGRWTQRWGLWFELMGVGFALGQFTLAVIYNVERESLEDLQKTLKAKNE